MADFSKTGALALVIEQVLVMFSDFAMSISATPPCVFHYCPLMEGTNSLVTNLFIAQDFNSSGSLRRQD